MLARQEAARQEIRGDCQFPDSMGLPVSSIEIPWREQKRSQWPLRTTRKAPQKTWDKGLGVEAF